MESESPLECLANLIAIGILLGLIWIVRVLFTALGAAEAYPCFLGYAILLAPIIALICSAVRRRRAGRPEAPPEPELWFVEFPEESAPPASPPVPRPALHTAIPPAIPRPPLVRRPVRRRRRAPNSVIVAESLELQGGSCLVCRGPLEEDVVYCRRCGTPQHRECFRYARACSVYACRSRQYRKKAPEPRESILTIP